MHKKTLKSGQDFVNLVAKRLSNYADKHSFGVVFALGSKDLKNDIDIYWHPSGKKKIGETYIDQVHFISEIKKELKKDYDSDLILFSMVSMKGVIEYYSNRKENEVLYHNLFFADYKDLFNRANLDNDLLKSKNIQILHGTLDALTKEYSPEEKFYYYNIINANLTLSNIDEQAAIANMKNILSYTAKHIEIDNTYDKIRTVSDLNKEMYDTLKKIDSLA